MKVKNPEMRLSMFWGRVDNKHINIIKKFVIGQTVLDMGCGYGSTTKELTNEETSCIGIDYDDFVVESAHKRFPKCKFKVANAESMPFADNSFDTIILRDALHHFYGEANFDMVKLELKRVAKKNSRIIFFDPNINFILRTLRRISNHKDEECDYETAKEIMNSIGAKTVFSGFNTLYSLPLSGGYVGRNFVPNVKFVYRIVLASERVMEIIINWLGLGRYLCIRYIIVGEFEMTGSSSETD